jgi:hypothetical protein
MTTTTTKTKVKEAADNKAEIRKEAQKDATLYFLVVLGSYLDELVRDVKLTSELRKDIYMIMKDYAIQRGYIS